MVTPSVESHRRIFKAAPFVPDKGIDNVLKDLASRRSVPREFFGRPELFRENAPLERVRRRSAHNARWYARFSAILRRATAVS